MNLSMKTSRPQLAQCIPTLALLLLIAITPSLRAQPDQDFLRRILQGDAPDAPARPAKKYDLKDQARRFQKSIFLIGHPDGGTGTGFVLSQEHRLLATNAHVADILIKSGTLLAIGNQSSSLYRVEKVWYHPGVKRMNGGRLLTAQSPEQGKIDVHCADLAVLELSGEAQLPEAIPLATWDEAMDAFAQPVAMIGFPGHDTKRWPMKGGQPRATFHDGAISHLTDLEGNSSSSTIDARRIAHTADNWFGFSGSPLILPNGHVIGINSSVGRVSQKGYFKKLQYGLRIDCLWELIAFHHLHDKVPLGFPRERLRIYRFHNQSPATFNIAKKPLNKLMDANSYFKRGMKWIEKGENDLAISDLTQALLLDPKLAWAYYNRSVAWCRKGKHERSRSDSNHAIRLEPTEGLFYAIRANSFLKSGDHVKALEDCNWALRLKPGSAWVYHVRGRSWNAMGKPDKALADFTAAIQFDNNFAPAYRSRGNVWNSKRQFTLAKSDYCKAVELLPKSEEANNTLAWFLATCPDANIRDGRRAIRHASIACQIGEWKCAACLDTLAAAYAETSQFSDAIRWQLRATDLAGFTERNTYLSRLRLYEAKKPYRVPIQIDLRGI